jgi:hypothetical protein
MLCSECMNEILMPLYNVKQWCSVHLVQVHGKYWLQNFKICHKTYLLCLFIIYLFEKSIFGGTASRYKTSQVLSYISHQYYNYIHKLCTRHKHTIYHYKRIQYDKPVYKLSISRFLSFQRDNENTHTY